MGAAILNRLTLGIIEQNSTQELHSNLKFGAEVKQRNRYTNTFCNKITPDSNLNYR